MTKRKSTYSDVSLKNFSITRMRILVELATQHAMWSADVAEKLGTAPGPTSDILARMTKDREVRRVFFRGWRRYRYSITHGGRELLNRTYRHATGKEFGCEDHG